MTVEDTRGSCGSDFDDFPRGMRVLAVDDDLTCLKVLESLLRKCQYHVTLANQAKTALNMLRENRDRFDLIISDVHMPDMDGFKLLEFVGLEMDLPVIMLSVNSDPKLVMKGITHGACDYLVKPVRIEELRNIWQHVIRKKVDPKSRDKSNSNDRDWQGSEGGQGHAMTGNADQNGMIGRKRKDEEEEGEENDPDDDDPSTQKKPRVVWSIELHRKFVAAVNQLGLEKAVPKRILDLMNVDGLTRENVASHLQKYRLYLKRISSAASQQANMVAALGGKDAYLRMGTLDGLGDYRSLSGSGRILNTGLSSYSPRLLGQFNSPSSGGLRGLTSSAVIHPNPAQSLSNPINALGKFQPVVSQALQSPNFVHGIPSSLEFDQFQQSNATAQVGDFSSIDDQRKFSVTNTFTDARATVGCSGNLLPTGQSNPLILQGNAQQIQNGLGFINQSFINLSSLNSESFNVGTSGSSNIMDEGRCGENWQNAYQLSKFSSNTSPLNEPFNNSQMPPNSMIYNNSSSSTHVQNSPMHFSSNSTTSAPSEDSRGECQGGLVGKFVQNVDQVLNQRFRQHKQDYTNNSNNAFSTLNALATSNGGATTFNWTVDQSNGGYNRNIDVSLVGRSNGSASTIMQHREIDESTVNSKLRSNEGYLLEQTKSHGGLVPNNYDSLDDIMNTLMKREQDGNMLMEGEFGLNAYTFGSCI